jgi:hypothetical protein
MLKTHYFFYREIADCHAIVFLIVYFHQTDFCIDNIIFPGYSKIGIV